MDGTYTRNSAITDKPHDAFSGQSRSSNMVPFHMSGMVSSITNTKSLAFCSSTLSDFFSGTWWIMIFLFLTSTSWSSVDFLLSSTCTTCFIKSSSDRMPWQNSLLPVVFDEIFCSRWLTRSPTVDTRASVCSGLFRNGTYRRTDVGFPLRTGYRSVKTEPEKKLQVRQLK